MYICVWFVYLDLKQYYLFKSKVYQYNVLRKWKAFVILQYLQE